MLSHLRLQHPHVAEELVEFGNREPRFVCCVAPCQPSRLLVALRSPFIQYAIPLVIKSRVERVVHAVDLFNLFAA